MKLHECKINTAITLAEDAVVPPAHRELKAGEVLKFGHVDGMYSYCTDAEGKPVHPAAWTEVTVGD